LDVAEAYKLQIEKHDRYGKNWDCCGVPWFQEEYEELLKTAGIGASSKVLDLGCGTGGLTLKISQKLGRSGSVTGVDILPGWLNIARLKAKVDRIRNADFKVMNIESLELPEGSFDHVVSNFVLCCSFQYDKAVKEAFRVLKKGGRFTYNHPGPHDSLLVSVFDKVFSRYMTGRPSENLRRMREANELQRNLYLRYTDPFTALGTMRTSGFGNVEAKIAYHKHSFPNVENWIDNWFYLGKEEPELLEMGPKNKQAFTRELHNAFQPFQSHNGYESEFETLYITGIK
jgi:ubiquinone/menaquinone biosynthesis C-methylase UbiE